MKDRESLEMTPFPFTAFKVDVEELSQETLNSFETEIGSNINRLFIMIPSWYNRKRNIERIARLLSRTPHLTVLQLEKPNGPIILTDRDQQQLFPISFPQLQVIELSGNGNSTRYEDERNEGLLPLFDLLISRATNLKKLQFKNMEPSWDLVLVYRNLTSLQIQFKQHEGEVFRSALRNILTHLTQLVHLDLEVTFDFDSDRRESSPDSNWRCWDILTGGAVHPRPVLEFTLADWNMIPETSVPEKPVDGIYRVPTLRNMRGKHVMLIINYFRTFHVFN